MALAFSQAAWAQETAGDVALSASEAAVPAAEPASSADEQSLTNEQSFAGEQGASSELGSAGEQGPANERGVAGAFAQGKGDVEGVIEEEGNSAAPDSGTDAPARETADDEASMTPDNQGVCAEGDPAAEAGACVEPDAGSGNAESHAADATNASDEPDTTGDLESNDIPVKANSGAAAPADVSAAMGADDAVAAMVVPRTKAPEAKPAKTAKKAAARVATGKGDLAAGVYFIASKLASTKVIGVSSKSKKDGANVDLWQVLGQKQQQWKVIIGKDGLATLKLARSGKVLTIAGSKKADGTNVLQWKAKAKNNLNQRWIIEKQGKYYRLVSALDTSKVLNVWQSGTENGTNVNIWTWKKRDRQLFKFISATAAKQAKPGEKVIADGLYTIHSVGAQKRALDVAGHTGANGARVLLQNPGAPAGQVFNVSYDGAGYYHIVNVRSGKKVAPVATANLPGIGIEQRKLGNASDLAKWRIDKKGSGYRLVNKATSLVLDMKGSDAEPGVARAEKASASECQQFTFKHAKAFGAGVYSFEVVGSKALSLGIAGSSAKKGAKAVTSKTASDLGQRFLVSPYEDGFTIRPFSSRLFLTVSAKNTLVQDKAHAKRTGQLWNAVEQDGNIMFVNAESGLALTLRGKASKAAKSIGLAKPAASAAQMLYARMQPVVDDGVYYIHMHKTGKQFLNVEDGKRVSGVNVNTWSKVKEGQNQQRFAIVSLGKGRYSVSNVSSGRVMEVKGGNGKDAANVQMFKDKGYKRQQWKIELNGNFTYRFTNVKTGQRLSISGGKVADGTNVKTAKAKHGAAYQEFWLEPTVKNVETVTIKVPCYMQKPQLPTGCESVALTNAIRYWGFKLAKTTIANHWMPYGGNGVYNFIGNPRNESGWIICAPGIMNTANKYLKSKGSKVRARNVTGTSLRDLRQYIDKGCPVVVWTTIGMGNPSGVIHRRSGYPLRYNNHAVVLSGYNPKTNAVQVADSLAGVKWRSGAAFNRLYNLMGKQAVVLED